MEINHEEWDISFIGEKVQVEFDDAPLFSKKPHCPDRVWWQGELWMVEKLITEWRDYGRRGKRANNMRPENIVRAKKKGSWGVGRYYFRVCLDNGRLFDLYYDRAPKGLDQRQGSWHLHRELIPKG